MEKQRIYMVIDMKCFFASVECAERGLNPFETNLVVTDASRGSGAICLAVSPKMKKLGVKNRCRIFEIPKNIEYISAMPRMKKYIEYAADIYEIYLQYIDKSDIHVYSIDESFIDVTDYLKIYNNTPRAFAKMLIEEIATKKKIPATCGIGTNMYLAKIALDITAKKSPDHISYLDEELYKEQLWHHTPLTDFWQIGLGIAKRLNRRGIIDMYDLAHYPEELLYKEFGINAELIIDHAWGKESCLMKDIKNYKGQTKSVSSSQILFHDYEYESAKLVIEEMVRNCSLDLINRKVVTDSVNILVGYAGEIGINAKGHIKMTSKTNVANIIIPYVDKKFYEITDKSKKIKRLGIEFSNVLDKSFENYDLFTDLSQVKKQAELGIVSNKIKSKFGKNAIIMGADLQEDATT
ncbi:MAG: DNA repair protein, partial [Firmicutes bacterium]|nr:DNA repair protein [Candidatus Caballimonas caccae]